MLNIPRVKKCPCCDTVNFIKIGKQTYANEFKTLAHWILQKKFQCRKCKEEIGLFLNVSENFEKLIWLNALKCEENYYEQLNSLENRKARLGKKSNEKHNEISNNIASLKEKINQEKIKLKVKFKIQHPTSKIN
tara:strand:+ start:368 stop:769 length:402 start_codon:yes stop_codon:yes gene_type:complete